MMPTFISELMDAEYEKRARYGEREGKTTFRNEMIKTITEQMVYSPKSSSYDDNYFTKAVRSVLETEIKRFQTEFNSIVTKEFTKNTVDLVTSELRKKFSV
jgi:hypothetical protein